jgi:ATP-binding cassette subfamily F protein 3
MSRISAHNLVKSFGGRDLFVQLSVELSEGMRLAVTGPNGCGKSTLLRILAGAARPDAGSVVAARGARVGYVAQELSPADIETPLFSWVLAALPSWGAFWAEWERAAEGRDQARLTRLSERQAELERAFGYSPDHKARAILTGLGFVEADLRKRLAALSGGWRERAKLARVLLMGADVLLLDEPTNHLDIAAVEWLERYLLAFRGAVAFVVHDRVFLDRVGTHVLFLSGGMARLRKGSFEEFLGWEQENAEQLSREAAKLSARIEHEQAYIRRFRVKARKAAQAQSKLKRVDKLSDELMRLRERQSLGRAGKSLSFALPEPARGDRVAVSAEALTFRHADGRDLWPPISFHLHRGRKVALLGANGVGKSSLLRLIVGLHQPSRGRVQVGGRTTIGYFSQRRTDILDERNVTLAELRRLSDPRTTEEELKSVLGLFLLGQDFFERPVGLLSGGEKSRLLLASLFLARANLLVLDEPTNHLDLESREGLVAALRDFEGTLLFVAHDRHLLAEVADEVWHLDARGLDVFPGGFADYEQRRAAEAARAAEVRHPAEARRPSKDEKRRRAEARNRLYRELKPLRGEYERLSAELSAAIEEQSGLEARLADPSVYADSAEVVRLNQALREVSVRAEALLDRLAGLEAEMGRVEARFAPEPGE